MCERYATNGRRYEPLQQRENVPIKEILIYFLERGENERLSTGDLCNANKTQPDLEHPHAQ